MDLEDFEPTLEPAQIRVCIATIMSVIEIIKEQPSNDKHDLIDILLQHAKDGIETLKKQGGFNERH